MLVIEDKTRIQAVVLVLELVFIIAFRKFLFSSLETSGIWEMFISSALLLFVFPFLTIKFVFNEDFKKYNWNFKKTTIRKAFFLALILSGVVAFVMLKLKWLNLFPVSAWVIATFWLVVFIDLVMLPIIALANEFFFRGILQETLKKSGGALLAIIFQTIGATAYAIFLGGAFSWTKLGFFVSLNALMGVIAHFSKSIFASAIVHWLLLVSIDFLALYHISQLEKLVK